MPQTNTFSQRTMSDEELEKKLKPYVTAINVLTILIVIGVVGTLADVVIMLFMSEWSSFTVILLFVSLALLFGALYLAIRVKAKYDVIFMKEMGSELEELIASYIGPQLEPEADVNGPGADAIQQGLRQAILESDLTEHFDSCYPNSYRKGSWKGQIFEGFNVKLTETYYKKPVDDKGNAAPDSEEHIQFVGTWMFVELKKQIPQSVIVKEIHNSSEKKDPFWNVSVGSPVFREKYCVHADDPGLACEILTEQFTEQLLELSEFVGAECGFCFSGNKLYMAIHGRKMFLNMDGESTEHINNLRENLRASLEHTCGILDRLMQNTQLFG